MTKKRQQGRRRRGKKDVILDFSKGVKRKEANRERDDESGQTAIVKPIKKLKTNTTTTTTKPDTTMTNIASEHLKRKKSNDDRLSLRTSSKDYGSNLGLPDKIEQREFETTGQFFRRLDRLVAKARVEANLETRFDMTIAKGQKSKVNHDGTTTANSSKSVSSEKVDSSQRQQSSRPSRLHQNKRKKRLKR